MANNINFKKRKEPRISKEKRAEIVKFYKENEENFELTKERYEKELQEFFDNQEYKITEKKLYSWIRIEEEGGDKLKEKSLLPLLIFEILRKDSSYKNAMSESDIKEKINEYYRSKNHPEIDINDRKIIRRHADGLVNALGNDLIKKKETPESKKTLWYYNNNPTSSHEVLTQTNSNSDFKLGEMAFLIDIVKDSRVISSKCTNKLIEKLVGAIDETERQNLVLPENSDETSKPIIKKSDNTKYLEFNDIIEKAIKDAKKVTIYDMDENGMDVTPIKIVHHAEDDKYCLVAVDENHQPQKYSFEDIWDIADKNEDGYYPDGFDLDAKQESESFKRNKTIALDSLFINMKKINQAIKESQYITFAYLSCKVRLTKQGETEFIYEQSEDKTRAPYKTCYKDGKPYLITVDPKNDYKPEFFRIDLMQDIRSHGNVDFMDRYGVRTLQDCADNHPYPDLLAREFTEITAAFAIREDNLDRVIDAFGNKAKYYGSKKGWELGSDKVEKLSKAFEGFDFSTHLGLDHNETYCLFKVKKTTLVEIKRFGMENADVVECFFEKEIQDRIRDEMKALAEKVVKRYSKKTEWTLEKIEGLDENKK